MPSKSEFETERANLIEDLTLLEDHGFGRDALCPFCAEKHSAKIAGHAYEIAAGGEDREFMTALGDKAQEWQKVCNELKQTHDENTFRKLAEEARDWRRKLQGADEHHHVGCKGPNCELKMGEHSHEHDVDAEK